MTEEEQIRILVVDDDNAARETLSELLTMEGYRVATAPMATTGLEMLEQQPFDLILSDIVMPKMDGIALTKSIKELNTDIPIIVMTGFATIEHAVESMKAGAFDFVTKPFNIEQIKLTINRALDTQKLQQLVQEKEYYKKLSNVDELTGLANFRNFKETLHSEIERSKRYERPLALLMIDIDDFKAVNDTYGHLVGDMALKQIAALVKKNTRGCDIVARYGGEEFCVILPETVEEEALVVAQRIRQGIAVHEIKTDDGRKIGKISVTIGLSSFPEKAVSTTQLIETSDRALYDGKTGGKNRVVVFVNPA